MLARRASRLALAIAVGAREEELHIDPLHETTMGEIIREMVLEGRGFAWLQSVLIDDDLKNDKLVPRGNESWTQTNEIRAFRALGSGRSRLEDVWGIMREISLKLENSTTSIIR